MGGDNVPIHLKKKGMVSQTPWRRKETDVWVTNVRPLFHYISWEYDIKKLLGSVNDTDWEDPRLVSIVVMRNPLERLLSDVGRHVLMEKEKANTSEWWPYANTIGTDNYALRTIMSKEGCCQGANTSEDYVKMAKSYLSRFTFIIDQDCFDESLEALSSILNLRSFDTKPYPQKKRARLPAKDRIKTVALYDYIVKRNTKDIELYEWARTQAMIKCPESSLI
jgi:hypothetical protein